jgi:hypothetical protein
MYPPVLRHLRRRPPFTSVGSQGSTHYVPCAVEALPMMMQAAAGEDLAAPILVCL